MTYLYRKNGGEVLAANGLTSAYGSGIESIYFAAVVNPETPDGPELSPPKICAGGVVRNATAPEIAAFPTAAAADATARARTWAVEAFASDVCMRKILRAIVGLTVQQLNVLRQNPSATLAALDENTVRTAIVNAINAGTYD